MVTDADLEAFFYKDYYIAEYMLKNRVNLSDFKRYGDSNLIKEKIYWIRKKATPLDVAAKELTDYLNVEVTPQDLIDVVLDYKSPQDYLLSLKEQALEVIKRQQGIGAIYKTSDCPKFIPCKDGTFSTSKGKGACSGHGGVLTFEKEKKSPRTSRSKTEKKSKDIPITEQVPKYKIGDLVLYVGKDAPSGVANYWEIGFVNYYAGAKWKGTYRLQRYDKGKSIQKNNVYESSLLPVPKKDLKTARVYFDYEKNYIEKKKYKVPAAGTNTYITNQPLTIGAKQAFDTSSTPYKINSRRNWSKTIWWLPTLENIQPIALLQLKAAEKEGFVLGAANTATSAKVYYLSKLNGRSILTPNGANFLSGAYYLQGNEAVKKEFCDLSEDQFIKYLYATPHKAGYQTTCYRYGTSFCMVMVWNTKGSKVFSLGVFGKDEKPSYDFDYEENYPSLYEALKAAYWVYNKVYECSIAPKEKQASEVVLQPKKESKLDERLKQELIKSGWKEGDFVYFKEGKEEKLGTITNTLKSVGQFVITDELGKDHAVFPSEVLRKWTPPKKEEKTSVVVIEQEDYVPVQEQKEIKPDITLIDPNKSAIDNVNELLIKTQGLEWDNAAQLIEAFYAVYDLKEALTEELKKLKKTQLLQILYNLDVMGYYRHKNDNKPEIIKQVRKEIAISFLNNYAGMRQISFGSNYWKAPFEYAKQRIQDEWTEENYQEVKRKIAAKKAAKEKAVSTPETLEEFKIALKKRDLTPEEEQRYNKLQEDDLLESAKLLRTRLEKEKERKKQQMNAAKAVDVNIDFEVTEKKHTKTGETLYVAIPTGRTDTKEQFRELLSRAKKLGGFWSKWDKGFRFPSMEIALQFANVSQQIEKQEQELTKDTWTKFREAANNIESKADEVLTADRKTNTARRLRMAKGVISDAEGKKWFAALLRAIAQMQETGATQFLSWVQFQTEIQTLLDLERHARFKYMQQNPRNDIRYEQYRDLIFNEPFSLKFQPYLKSGVCLHVGFWERFIEKAEKTKGAIQFAKKIKKYLVSVRKLPQDQQIFCLPSYLLDDLGGAIQKVVKDNYSYTVLVETYKDVVRLKRLGLDDPKVLFAAVKELNEAKKMTSQFKSDTSATIDFELQELRQSKSAKKDFDYFPTNPEVSKAVARLAKLQPGFRVLEPSAGDGALVKAVRQEEPSAIIEAVEIQSKLRDYLTKNGFNVVDWDFMSFNPEYKYDAVVMNPPFSKRQDSDHVLKAYSLLKPNGRLVAIVSEGTMNASDKKSQALQDLFSQAGVYDRKLIGEFKDVGTNVNARLIVLEGGATINGFENTYNNWNTRIISSLALGFLFTKAFKKR
jgi:guanylate kinase